MKANQLDENATTRMTAGTAMLSRLAHLGVDYIFANSGTDFPPIIEGLAEARHKDLALPEAVVIPFESAAMGMAHGYYLATGRAQVVMAHTNVGLANCAIGAINAATENIPVLLMSGRTPTLEKGRLGARTVPIGWGQEMLDQTALVREACKWNYELRFPEQINDLMDRAYGIATSTPTGPTYVSLPREVLCESVDAAGAHERVQMRGARSAPFAEDVDVAAQLIADANNPVIFAQRGAGSAEAFAALAQLAGDWGIPVCQYWATQLAVATDHPLAAGPDPAPLLSDADVVLVIDALAPWSPSVSEPAPDCKVIQLGADPLQSRFGARNFRADLCLPGETAQALLALKAALDHKLKKYSGRNSQRADKIAKEFATDRAARQALATDAADDAPLTKPSVSAALSKALVGRDATVFSELGCQLPYMHRTKADSWYDAPLSGGLGWGFPAALGFKLARPNRTVVATVGDGSYLFANPVACHQVAESLGLSIVVIVLNNEQWGAVRRSVFDIYPTGYAAKSDRMPLTSLAPSPDFARVAEASRAWARRVQTAQQFDTAIAEALTHTEAKRGLALIEVAIEGA